MVYGFRGGVSQTPVPCEIRKIITAFRFVSTYKKFISCELSAHACL